MTEHERPSARRPVHTVVVALVAILAVYFGNLVYQVASNGGLPNVTPGRDIAISLAAARAASWGENIYSSRDSFPGAHAYLNQTGVPIATRAGLDTPDSVLRRPGNPPLMFWLLMPMTALNFRIADLIWIAFLLVLLVSASIGVLSALGWRHRVLPTLMFLAMPQTFMAVWVGNINVVAFSGIALAFATAARYPLLAGALLGAAWLKPEQALPFALLVWLFSPGPRGRTALGFVAVTMIGLAVTALSMGPSSLVHWGASLITYTSDLGQSDDLSTFMGLANPWVSGTPKLLIELACLAVAVTLTGLAWWRVRDSRAGVQVLGWLWGVWILCLPYVHFHDLIVLAIPVFYLIGPEGQNLPRRIRLLFADGARGFPSFLCIFVAFLAVIPYNLYPVVFTAFDPLPLCVAVMTVCLAVGHPRARGSTLPIGVQPALEPAGAY